MTEPISSPVDSILNQINTAILCNSEAVERLACRTERIRLSHPACPTNMKDVRDQPAVSHLEEVLTEILTRITRNTDNLNNLTDEIRL